MRHVRTRAGLAVALIGMVALLALFIRSRGDEPGPDPVVTEEHDAT
jgi:hypothetical protein